MHRQNITAFIHTARGKSEGGCVPHAYLLFIFLFIYFLLLFAVRWNSPYQMLYAFKRP